MKSSIVSRLRPSLEALEDRCTPSAASSLHTVLPAHAAAGSQNAPIAHIAPFCGPTVPSHTGNSDTHTVPFKINGGGSAPLGVPVFPGGIAPHNATGHATGMGNYTGNEGSFEMLSLDLTTGTGTFRGSFVFVAANGDRAYFDYGADPNHPGTFTLNPAANGEAYIVFVAEFTPDASKSTGKFAKVTGGSFTMVATTDPFLPVPNAQGYTPPFTYTWEGSGTLEFSNGNESK